MLTLYVKTGCPYCAKVLQAGEELGIEFSLRNIAEDGARAMLAARGGKVQVPYLVDEERGKELYESDAIVAYLHETFTPRA